MVEVQEQIYCTAVLHLIDCCTIQLVVEQVEGAYFALEKTWLRSLVQGNQFYDGRLVGMRLLTYVSISHRQTGFQVGVCTDGSLYCVTQPQGIHSVQTLHAGYVVLQCLPVQVPVNVDTTLVFC